MKEATSGGEWITVNEMRRMLSLGRSKTYALLAQEEAIETVQLGRALRVNRTSLERWLEGQRYPKWRGE